MRTVPFDELVSEGTMRSTPTVFSIGVFDGVHQGHRAVFERLMAMKDELGAEAAAVITFSTNPKGRYGALDTMRLRAEYIARFGVDVLAVIDFSPVFSKISACGFAALLARAFVPRGAVFGQDFRFGNPGSQGTGADLERLLGDLGYSCRTETVDSVLDSGGERVSSTRLRQMIEKGELRSFLGLSGQFYRVDLVPLPYRSCSGELIFSRASIHQLLPPPGSYDAALCHADGKEEACIALIGESDLRIRMDAAATASSDGTCGKEAMLLDSLYLEKRR